MNLNKLVIEYTLPYLLLPVSSPIEHFTFASRRHLDMPFGLTFYLDGMMDYRMSACCEYRHQSGKLLGSKTAHFGLVRVEGGRPCYRCQAVAEKRAMEEKRRQEEEANRVGVIQESVEEGRLPQDHPVAREESAAEGSSKGEKVSTTLSEEAQRPEVSTLYLLQ